MSADMEKPKMSFAKVAASGNASRTPVIVRSQAAPPAPNVAPQARPVDVKDDTEAPGLNAQEHAPDAEKFTPRQAKSVPVSEENVERLTSMRPAQSTLSTDEKSTASGTTFPLDEKESLRPDDSASVQAGEDDDGPSSRFGSDAGARAFSEQLREISIMGPRHPAAMARMNSAQAAGSGILYSPAPSNPANAIPPFSRDSNTNGMTGTTLPTFAPDEKLLEALNSVRDRVWVLKLEQDVLDFLKDSSQAMYDLPQCNSFYRMLAHKMADYYLLGHTMDSSLATVRLWKTPNSRIPPRLSEVTNPSTAASTPPPLAQMKILRRNENGTRPSSREGADGDSGSDGGKNKLPASREEREARYEAARLRILGSAKPAEEDNPPTGDTLKDPNESKSNSVIGKRKTRKQRTDSEDGFEARSAFSMYGPGAAAQLPKGPIYADTMPMAYPDQIPYGMAPAYNGYVPAMDPSQSKQPWYPQQYQMLQPYQAWPQEQFGGDHLTAQMSNMSLQQPSMMNGVQPMGNGSPQYGSPSHVPAYPAYPAMAGQGQYGDMYSGPFPGQHLMRNQGYPYGMLPHQQGGGNSSNSSSSKRHNPNHPLPGSFNRQNFNPQSQTFIPVQSGSPYQQNFPAYSPAMSHVSTNGGSHLQRQQSNQSHYHPPPAAPPPQPQTITQPSPHTLTHPLPQPVYVPQGPQSTTQQQHNSQAQRSHPSTRDASSTRESSIAKFAAPSLPAKPPRPLHEHRFGTPHLAAATSGSEPAVNGARKPSPRV